MDLLQLRYFRAVARHEHVGRAAAEMMVAQPSVSRSLIRLEKELGAPLFDRVGRGLRLNRNGRQFLAAAARGLDAIDDGVRELDDALGVEAGSVTVAAESLLPVAVLAARFHEQHAGAELTLRQATAPQMAGLLAAGEVDLCVASQPVPLDDVRSRRLDEERVLLVAPDRHPLAGRARLRAADLAGIGFVLPHHGYWQRTLFDTITAGLPVPPTVACEVSEPGTTLQLVRAGLGVTLLPDVARREVDPTGLAWIPLHDRRARRVFDLVWREGAYLSRTAQAFASLAVEHFGPRRARRS